MSKPPLLPPMIARWAGEVYFRSIKCSALAMKSLKTFCFWVSLPAPCHS
jgi:hypothetical protein